MAAVDHLLRVDPSAGGSSMELLLINPLPAATGSPEEQAEHVLEMARAMGVSVIEIDPTGPGYLLVLELQRLLSRDGGRLELVERRR